MMDMVTFKALLDGYNALSFTHQYITGFTDRGTVYACFHTSEDLPFITKLDTASRGQGKALRFKPTKAQKEYLKVNSQKIIALCSAERFNAECKASKYNKGEIFEKLITEYFGQEWEKDSLDFTSGPDLTVNSIGYQVKYESATYTNEKALASLKSKRA